MTENGEIIVDISDERITVTDDGKRRLDIDKRGMEAIGKFAEAGGDVSKIIQHTPILDYHWAARHSDEKILHQYNKDGSENSFLDDIDHEKLVKFALVPSSTGSKKGLKPFVLNLDPSWQKLVYRRRVYIRSDGKRWLIYLLGWKADIDGKTFQSICFILPDGTTHISDNFELM